MTGEITLAGLGDLGVLLMVVCGLLAVLVALAIANLMAISKLAGGTEQSAPAAPAAIPAAVAPAAAAPVQDEGELVAVLMAAIAAETGSSLDSFRIASIQPA